MNIKYALLGFLSWRSFSGYDLKKIFADSVLFHWSGNNNQIYRTLVQLNNEQLVSHQVVQDRTHPSRKMYSITAKGIAELKTWTLSSPEVAQFKNSFLVQLCWADQASNDELNVLLQNYEHEISMHILSCKEKFQRGVIKPERTPRETFIWNMVSENWLDFYERERAWVQRLRKELSTM